MKVKYGKIKHPSCFSNIFGTTIQLIIRMKPLIDKQYDLYIKNTDSQTIPAIIDIYEQTKAKQEYLNIDPFIHSTKNALNINNKEINFLEFFTSVLLSIDPSFLDEQQTFNDPIAFTSLKSKKSKEDIKSYFFEISIENDQKISTIIESQYEFSETILYKPKFLFFYLNNSKNKKIILDDKIFFNTFYKLSIIVVKKIERKDLNSFVLFIGIESWIRIEDEEIVYLSKNEVFNEILNQKVYRIEILGFCFDPSKFIVPIDNSESRMVEQIIIGDDQVKYKKKNIQNISIYQTNNNSKFRVNYFEFDHSNFSFNFISSTEFFSSNQRDKYLSELDTESRNKRLYYNSNNYFGHIQCFDKIDNNITVFEVDKNKDHLLKKPVEIFFYEYQKNDPKLIPKIDLFHPKTTLNELFEYSLNNLPGKPSYLFVELNGKIQKIIKSKSSIESITRPNIPTIIYYTNNENINSKSSDLNKQSQIENNEQKQANFKKTQISSKPAILPNIIQKVDPNKLTVMRCLKSFLYDDTKNFYLKVYNTDDKLKLKGNLNFLISKLYSDQKAEVLAYTIEYENGFKVNFFDKEKTQIQSLPSLINVQTKLKSDFRVCVIRKEPIFYDENDHSIDFSFIAEFYSDLRIFTENIMNYLYHNKSESKLFNLQDYRPKLFTFENSQFHEIDNIEVIKQDRLKPVFLIWKSSSVYDYVMKVIKNHCKDEKLALT